MIERDLTSPSLDKFAIFAQVGVPEVWPYDDNRLRIFRGVDTVFIEQEASTALHHVTAAEVSRFLGESRVLERLTWLRRVRAWARTGRDAETRSS